MSSSTDFDELEDLLRDVGDDGELSSSNENTRTNYDINSLTAEFQDAHFSDHDEELDTLMREIENVDEFLVRPSKQKEIQREEKRPSKPPTEDIEALLLEVEGDDFRRRGTLADLDMSTLETKDGQDIDTLLGNMVQESRESQKVPHHQNAAPSTRPAPDQNTKKHTFPDQVKPTGTTTNTHNPVKNIAPEQHQQGQKHQQVQHQITPPSAVWNSSSNNSSISSSSVSVELRKGIPPGVEAVIREGLSQDSRKIIYFEGPLGLIKSVTNHLKQIPTGDWQVLSETQLINAKGAPLMQLYQYILRQLHRCNVSKVKWNQGVDSAWKQFEEIHIWGM